jgi:hypothetical protein
MAGAKPFERRFEWASGPDIGDRIEHLGSMKGHFKNVCRRRIRQLMNGR